MIFRPEHAKDIVSVYLLHQIFQSISDLFFLIEILLKKLSCVKFKWKVKLNLSFKFSLKIILTNGIALFVWGCWCVGVCVGVVVCWGCVWGVWVCVWVSTEIISYLTI